MHDNQPNMRLQVACAPLGTIACAFDIQAFHCTCPVLPDHKPWLVVCIDNRCWIDHDNPFGTRSASSNSGQSGNAIVDIWDAEDTDITFKYEDDMSQFQFSSAYGPFINGLFHYCHDRDSSMALIAPLNVPWHPTKTSDRFILVFIFIGFLWDLFQKQVSLPVHKRLKFLHHVTTFLSKADSHTQVSLLEAQQIHGSLVHICFIYLNGSSRLPAILNFMSSFKANEFARHFIPNSLISSLNWWYSRLSDPLAFWQLHPLAELWDLGIFVDASTSWGIGIIIQGRWYAFWLVEGWKIPGHDICWLEAIALELLVYFLIQLHFYDTHLCTFSDNDSAIGAHSKGHSRNSEINLCVLRTYAASAAHLISLTFKYIESSLNPADPISCRIMSLPKHKHLSHAFDLPNDLCGLLLDHYG